MLYYSLDKAVYAHIKEIVDDWANTSFFAGIKRTERACFTYHLVVVTPAWPLTLIETTRSRLWWL